MLHRLNRKCDTHCVLNLLWYKSSKFYEISSVLIEVRLKMCSAFAGGTFESVYQEHCDLSDRLSVPVCTFNTGNNT